MTAQRRPIAWPLLLVGVWAATSGTPGAVAARPVAFAADDGTTLAGTFYESDVRPSPGVVLVHMLHRSRSDWADVGGQLAAAGVSALAFDLRGHGGSSGQADALPAMTRDVGAAVEWLAARAGLRPDAIGVAGASLGANLALMAAAERPAIRAVAAISPSVDYRGVRVGPDVMRRIGERPVWLAASTEDPLALRTLKELSPSGPGPRDQYLSPAAAHGTNLLTADGNLSRALVDWLCQRLLS